MTLKDLVDMVAISEVMNEMSMHYGVSAELRALIEEYKKLKNAKPAVRSSNWVITIEEERNGATVAVLRQEGRHRDLTLSVSTLLTLPVKVQSKNLRMLFPEAQLAVILMSRVAFRYGRRPESYIKTVRTSNEKDEPSSSYKCFLSYNFYIKHMLAYGMEMIPKAQERLRALASSGGKAPEVFSVESSDDSLYFDVSSLAWRDVEFTGFFDNMAFQDKALIYSLAIRDEDKELSIAQGTTIPGTDALLAKLKEYLAEEFGSTVTTRAVRGFALSGNGEEEMDGIVAVSEECQQLGVFINVTRIGRKLSIKFYTLFIPHERDRYKQEQQAVSMSKKLSPKVNVWENGLKDSMLMAVQQLLNSNAPIGPISPVSPVSEPIFL